jgi:hypothetical protein
MRKYIFLSLILTAFFAKAQEAQVVTQEPSVEKNSDHADIRNS